MKCIFAQPFEFFEFVLGVVTKMGFKRWDLADTEFRIGSRPQAVLILIVECNKSYGMLFNAILGQGNG